MCVELLYVVVDYKQSNDKIVICIDLMIGQETRRQLISPNNSSPAPAMVISDVDRNLRSLLD